VLGPVLRVQGVVRGLRPVCTALFQSGFVAATSLPHALPAFGYGEGFGITSRTSRGKRFGLLDLSAVLAPAVSPAVASVAGVGSPSCGISPGPGPNNSSKPTPLRGAA
jgi:hypothetical protein